MTVLPFDKPPWDDLDEAWRDVRECGPSFALALGVAVALDLVDTTRGVDFIPGLLDLEAHSDLPDEAAAARLGVPSGFVSDYRMGVARMATPVPSELPGPHITDVLSADDLHHAMVCDGCFVTVVRPFLVELLLFAGIPLKGFPFEPTRVQRFHELRRMLKCYPAFKVGYEDA